MVSDNQDVQPCDRLARYMSYYRGLPISSLHVLECNFHVEYKMVMANVSMTCGKF